MSAIHFGKGGMGFGMMEGFASKNDTIELSTGKTERCNNDSMRIVPYFPKRLYLTSYLLNIPISLSH